MKDLETHVCTEEELGLKGAHLSKFKPIHKSSYDYVKLYQEKFVCLNEQDLQISGNVNSKKAKRLQVTLKRCHGHSYCKSSEEIQAFMQGKYLLLLHNSVRFDASKYNTEAIVHESRMDFIRIST